MGERSDRFWGSVQRIANYQTPAPDFSGWCLIAWLFGIVSGVILLVGLGSSVDRDPITSLCGVIGAATGYLGILLSLLLGRGSNDAIRRRRRELAERPPAPER